MKKLLISLMSLAMFFSPMAVLANEDEVVEDVIVEECFNATSYGNWRRASNGRWQFIISSTGQPVRNEYGSISGKYYLFDEYGYAVTGWHKEDGVWYYFNGDCSQAFGWNQIGGVWYYFVKTNDSSDLIADYGKGGMVQSRLLKIGSSYYYFDKNGVMKTGWIYWTDTKTWSYFQPNGAAAIGWCKVGNTWYYFNSECDMVTGWQQIGGVWYFFGTSSATEGQMFTGWHKIGGKWYYFEPSGAMHTGWLKLNGSWWFFGTGGDTYGQMFTGKHTIGGKVYYFDANGVWYK